jgi:hypothetical protein
MAEADLDVLIRSIARQNNKSLMEAAKKRRDRYMAMAAGAKNTETRDRYRLVAKNTLLNATAAAKRILTSAENAADSYVRAMKKAAEQDPPAKPAEAKNEAKNEAKKKAKKKA